MAAPISAHSNFYVQIKNKSLKLQDRLQLLKYCWKSSDLYFPNKEQVLLDVLTGILINKKNENLSPTDVCVVWKCLHEVLITKKAAEPGCILLKQSAVQLLTDSLTKLDSTCGFVNSLIGCLHGIMRSHSMSSVFSAKLETMVTVLSGICVMNSMETFNKDAMFSSLVNDTVDRFIVALETAPDQSQILQKICGSFLPKFIPLWSAEPSNNVKKLSSALLGSLCHRDHMLIYDVYLKANHGNTGTHIHKKAKHMELLFSTLSSLSKSYPVQCSLYLPVIYDNFIERNCHNGINLVAHYLMVELCSLMGLNKHDTHTNKSVEDVHIFVAVHGFLQVVKLRELYDLGLDEKNEHIQIQFYRHVLQVLVNCKEIQNNSVTSYTDWYGCFTTLLQINHHILEPKLIEILKVGWIDTLVADEDIEALDELLQEFVVIYSKLRQIPKLITKVLGSLCVSNEDKVLQIPPLFLIRYGEMVQSLPQGMMLDVWKKFTATLKTHFVEAEEPGCFKGVCQLFDLYLLNVRIADYSVTEMTLQSVRDLLTLMESDIFSPILTKYLDELCTDVQKLTFTLHLCKSWGELVTMLSFYSKIGMSFETKPVVKQPWDMSFVHGYLQTKQWLKLYKFIQKKKNACLLLTWDALIVQRLKSVMLFKNKSDWSSEVNAVTALLEFLSEVNLNQSTSWSGNFYAVNMENLSVGRWHLLTKSMSVICSVLSEEQIKTIASITIDSISSLKSRSGCTLCSLSIELLGSDFVRENANFLSNIISAIWSRCSKCFAPGKPTDSVKKKKTGGLLTSINSLMSLLSDDHFVSSFTDDSELSNKGREASVMLAKIIQSKESFYIEERDSLQCCLQLLQSLPLDKVPPYDQFKCMTGLLAMKCLTDKSAIKTENTTFTDISTTCVELCTVIIESCREASLFKMISMETYLSWLQSVLNMNNAESVDYYKCTVLAETSSQIIAMDFKVLDQLQRFVDKLISGESVKTDLGSLNLILFMMQEIGKLLNRSYLNETLKTKYTNLFLTMAKTSLKMHFLLKSEGSTHEKSIMIRIYTTVMTLLDKDETLKKEFMDKYGDILNCCEIFVEKMVRKDIYAVMSALMFFQTFYKHHKLLQDLVDQGTKWKTWELLVVVLKQLLVDQSVPSLVAHSVSSPMDTSTVNCDWVDHRDPNVYQKKCTQTVRTSSSLEDDAAQCFHHSKRIRNILDGSNNPCAIDTTLDKRIIVRLNCHENDSSANWDENVNQGSINTLFRSLMFNGKLEQQGANLIRMQVQNVMATLLVSFDLDLFRKVTQGLINDVHPDSLLNDKIQMQSSLLIWRYVLSMTLTDDQSKAIRHSAKDMMLNMHGVSDVLQYQVDDDLMRNIGVPILHVQKQMLSQGQKLLTSRSSVLCLHNCLYTPLSGSYYFPAFHAVYDILDTLLVHHSDTVFLNIPAYIQCCKNLLLSVVEHSNQDKISKNDDVIKELMSCAYQMERLFSLIATHKVEFRKVAVYVVSDYLSAVQKLTILPAVKRALIPAVYNMLDLCDKHAISQLHVVLNQGVTEVFRLLYNEYKKFHKYQGKV